MTNRFSWQQKTGAVLFCALLFLGITHAASAEERDPSNYRAPKGVPFFVLTDTQYGSADNALLRIEIPPGSNWDVRDFGGVDILLYRVPQPLAFLKGQKNLHRIEVKARPRNDGGVANTLSYLWSNAWNSSRSLWRDLFSRQAKYSVTATVPALGTRTVSPQYRPTTPFKPLEGFTLTHS
ncbi:MAG: hypothetical protein LBC37_04370, partial [Zoogloeaceae bacterium]|nr:hypothetical protein [Zoogloeaceae bacterium]